MSAVEKWQSITATLTGGSIKQCVELDSFLDDAAQFTVAQGSRNVMALFLTKDEAAQWAAVLQEFAGSPC